MPVKQTQKLTSKGVRMVMDAAIAKAEEFNIAVTIAIVDAGGHAPRGDLAEELVSSTVVEQ